MSTTFLVEPPPAAGKRASASAPPTAAPARARQPWDEFNPAALPEQRIVLENVTWEQYQAFDALLAGRHQPRLRYLDGCLEIMSISFRHEKLKCHLIRLTQDYLLEVGVDFWSQGSTTMAEVAKKSGREPDGSFCLDQRKPRPDLAIEVALSSGGVDKLEHYRRYGVPEVWLWWQDALHVFRLREDTSDYDPAERSACLPELDLLLLARCAQIEPTSAAIREFRRGLVTAAEA